MARPCDARRTSDGALDTPGIAPYIAADEASRTRLFTALTSAIDDKIQVRYAYDALTNQHRARRVLPRRVSDFRFGDQSVRRLTNTASIEKLVTDIEAI